MNIKSSFKNRYIFRVQSPLNNKHIKSKPEININEYVIQILFSKKKTRDRLQSLNVISVICNYKYVVDVCVRRFRRYVCRVQQNIPILVLWRQSQQRCLFTRNITHY